MALSFIESGSNVYSVDISADGEYITAGSDDDEVYLFDKDSSTPLWSYDIDGDSVQSVAISADGEYIVAGSYDDKVYFFDKDSSTPLWSYTTGDQVYSVSISADGEYVIAGSADDIFYVFSRESNTPLWTYDFDTDPKVVAISGNGEYIAVGTNDLINVHNYPDGLQWNVRNEGAATLFGPVPEALGMNYTFDDADDEGLEAFMADEVTGGVTGKSAFQVEKLI